MTVAFRNNGLVDSSGSGTLDENNAWHSQVVKRNISDRVRNEFEIVVAAVESRVLEAILTVMDSVVMQRVGVAVRSITGSSGHGTNSVVQSRDHRVFLGSMEATGS